jgi:DNA invertase Pin-like site-specific DNA recombinase
MPKPAQQPPARQVVYYTRVRDSVGSAQHLAGRVAGAHTAIAARPEWTLADVVTDTGSGLQLNPGLRGLLDHARNHEFDLLLVGRLSDLGRSTSVLDNVLTVLDECGIELQTLDGSMRIAPGTGQCVARLWALLSEYEHARLRERGVRRRRPITENPEKA